MVDFDYIATVPNTMHKGLREYIDRGIPVGGFLYHVLCNNLSDAVLVATDEELKSLRALVMWVYNCAPEASWGSEAKYLRWIQEHPGQARGPKDLE
jgi:hypothetical protein